MPTGYTSILTEKDNVSFREFALRCARAFGALISLREEPMDAPIPQAFEPDDYHLKALAKAEVKLREYNSMDDESKRSMALEAIRQSIASFEESRARITTENQKYLSMIDLVQDWYPPTDEHAGLKRFMIQQLESSMSNMDYLDRSVERMSLESADEWIEGHYSRLVRDVEYHSEELAKERERAASRTKWVQDLLGSL